MTAGERAGRLIVRGAQATGLGFGVRMGARFLFLFVAGRLFGATAFGAYVLAVAVVELAVSLGGLSMKTILFQLLDRGAEPGRPVGHILIDAVLLVALASLALGGAIMLAAALLPASLLTPATATALFFLAPMVAGQALLDLLLAATRWRHAMRYEVLGRSLIEPWALVAGATAAYALGLREDGLVVGYWSGTVAALLFALIGVRRRFGPLHAASFRPRPSPMAATLRSALPTAAANSLSSLYARLDLYLVGILLGEAPAGLYGMARQLAVPLRQVRQSFDGLLIPLVARTVAASGSRATGEALASATRLILAIQLAMLVAAVAIGKPVLEWFGPGFGAAWPALVMLAAAETVQSAFSMGDLIFIYLRPRVGLYLTLAGIALGIAGVLLMVPPFGVNGAALAVLAAYGLTAVLRSFILRRHFELAVPRAHHAGPLLAAALGAGAVVATWRIEGLSAGAHYPVSLIAGLGVYAAAVLVWLVTARESLSLTGFVVDAQARGP